MLKEKDLRIPMHDYNLIVGQIFPETDLCLTKFDTYLNLDGLVEYAGIAPYHGIPFFRSEASETSIDNYILRVSRGPNKHDYVIHYDSDYFTEEFIDSIPLRLASRAVDRRSLEVKTEEEVRDLKRILAESLRTS